MAAYGPVVTQSVQAPTWSSVVRSDGTDIMTVIGQIVDQRMNTALAGVKESLGLVQEQVQQLAGVVSESELDRSVVKYGQRVGFWFNRNGSAVKNEGETKWLRKERDNLVRIRSALIEEHGARVDEDSLPDLSDF